MKQKEYWEEDCTFQPKINKNKKKKKKSKKLRKGYNEIELPIDQKLEILNSLNSHPKEDLQIVKSDSFINFDVSQSSAEKGEEYKIINVDEDSSMFISNKDTKAMKETLGGIAEGEGEDKEIPSDSLGDNSAKEDKDILIEESSKNSDICPVLTPQKNQGEDLNEKVD